MLRAGRLTLEVGEARFAMAFCDDESGPVLVDASGPAGSPLGSVGFQTAGSGRQVWRGGPVRSGPGSGDEEAPPATGWHHAVAVLSAKAGPEGFEADLATDDPYGRRVRLVAQVVGEGSIAVTASVVGEGSDVVAMGQGFVARPAERFTGFGERSDACLRVSGLVEHYVGEGPWQEHEYPFLAGAVPPWGYRQRADATYFPVPWVLSTAGYGVLVDNDEVSYVRLRTEDADAWSLEVEATDLRYSVVAGPRPLDALARMTELAGRQPAPERWWFGPWFQTGHASHVEGAEEARQLARLRAERAPVSAAETHCRFLPVGAHRGFEAAEAERAARFHTEGLASVSYLSALLSTDFDELWEPARHSGALQRRADGSVCAFEGHVGDRQPPIVEEAQLDFSAEAGRRLFAEVAGQLVAAGHDGWMEDFGEYTPLDAVVGGRTGTAGHNAYPRDYHRGAGRVAEDLEGAPGRHGQRLARFSRSGWSRTAAFVPLVWGGDPTCGWGFDGLRSAVTEGLTMGASGVALWGSDTGGFVSSLDRLTPELLCRWIQFSAFSPLMRTKSSGIEAPPYRRPQIWDDEVVGHWRRWAAFHTQLNDYLLAAHATYRTTGRPLMTHLGLVWPEEEGALRAEDQYLFGPDLLVAPVLAPGATERSLWVPPGSWLVLWQVARYDDESRGIRLCGGPPGHGVVEGPGHVTLPAPAEEIPVLVRSGALLPLLSCEVDTLSDHGGDGCGAVRAFEREGERRLLAWPARSGATALGGAQAVTSEVSATTWRLSFEVGPTRRYDLHADLRLLGWAPVAVAVDGVALDGAAWSFDEASGVLRASFQLASGTVVVRGGSR